MRRKRSREKKNDSVGILWTCDVIYICLFLSRFFLVEFLRDDLNFFPLCNQKVRYLVLLLLLQQLSCAGVFMLTHFSHRHHCYQCCCMYLLFSQQRVNHFELFQQVEMRKINESRKRFSFTTESDQKYFTLKKRHVHTMIVRAFYSIHILFILRILQRFHSRAWVVWFTRRCVRWVTKSIEANSWKMRKLQNRKRILFVNRIKKGPRKIETKNKLPLHICCAYQRASCRAAVLSCCVCHLLYEFILLLNRVPFLYTLKMLWENSFSSLYSVQRADETMRMKMIGWGRNQSSNLVALSLQNVICILSNLVWHLFMLFIKQSYSNGSGGTIL